MNNFLSQHAHEQLDHEMVMIEVNLDDCSSEVLAYTMDQLLAAGANDVYYTSIYMKKNRPAYKLSVLTTPTKQQELEEIIFKETTSFGLRFFPVSCHRLGREFCKAKTQWGEVSVKIGIYQGERIKFSPEFEECRALAEKHNLPLQLIYDEAKSIAVSQNK
ncbi:nickel insertion protein [Fictibacillus sp. KU28468]|uniref:nickel insertion protein n=1 Tax=Fictibacillus sp. KU28468 TaxID=2991053 RepID=UPI00223D2B95|nr:nickel insertion protein [Fictibacillus sp. KU28468]UZJ79509.1 LarC family nickel insertion protein [Fictibacillus sp. KU28468]